MIATLTRFVCDVCGYKEDHDDTGPGVIRKVLQDGWSSKDGRDKCFACAAKETATIS